ncbi:hypothetical protein J0A67_09950 [Algoriphagus aestuariicola]|uniref:Uncharacterized protein n=1 Tax=Algoriphagus aestuariicola TaxID=1852016 RepID=A0ABS3BQ42_9BACT|nr:hypothetical protein [Algoriphagus aestuariicola]MBN7801185.1 hypothetical protein [Algoriphagus aestuariicola]
MKSQPISAAYPILALVFGILFSSCQKDEEPNQFTGSQEEIEEFLTPELTEIMTDLGLEINTGNTPPNIEGNYLAEAVLMSSSVAGDVPGKRFLDAVMKFENQNNKDLSVTFSYAQTIESGTGIGALIAGSQDSFSAILKVEGTHGTGSATAQLVMVISGKMTSEGIRDFQWALFMLDNKGDSQYIANNTGRVFKELDNIAEKTTLSIPSGRLAPGLESSRKSAIGR